MPAQLFMRSADGHDAPLAWFPGKALPRCTGRRCGHRQAHPLTGEQPRPTRTQPPWTWPGELAGRAAARRIGRLA